MKKKLLIIFILVSGYISHIQANPIIYIPVIPSELYFENNEWYLEIYIADYIFENNLDSVIIQTSNGVVYFKSGIEITPGDIIIITKDSLQADLEINPQTDFINIKSNYQEVWESMWDIPFIFGDCDNAQATAPEEGESLTIVKFDYWNGYGGTSSFYQLTKNTYPSLGYELFECSTYKEIYGYIFDMNGDPVENAHFMYFEQIIGCIYVYHTGYDGYFNTYAHCSIYDTPVKLNNQTIGNIIFTVEPYGNNYFEFILDDYEKIENITETVFKKCSPNPFTKEINFEFEINKHISKEGIIKIYNSLGEIVKIIPAENTANGKLKAKWNVNENNITNGTYFYVLEINGNKITSGKIVKQQ